MTFGKIHVSRSFVVVLLTAAANVLADPRSLNKWYESVSLVIAGALPGIKSATAPAASETSSDGR